MELIYLDNNATTRPDDAVAAAMDDANRALWANPSSVHRFGQMVRQRLELARAAAAELVGARPRELVFTSGGTEANNLAIRGLLGPTLGSATPGVLITTPVEHAAVREPAEAYEARGGAVVRLAVDHDGRIGPQQVADAVASAHEDGRAVLVSVQWANNETGVLQPVDAIARAAHEHKRVRLHVDATQAVGKIPVDVKATGVDLMTFAGHKFHGPKGVGALYVRAGVRLDALQRGGPQERELRGGTENTAGIIGLGVAAELARAFLEDVGRIDALRELRDRFEQAVCRACPKTVVNAGGGPRLWNTTNLGFPGLEAEAVLLGLSERGVCASAGAACSSGSLDPSPVLLAMGVPEPTAHGAVRFSLSRQTTPDEIDRAALIVPEVVRRLAQTLPVSA